MVRPSILIIPPHQIIAGLTYHLLTLKLAQRINQTSIDNRLASLINWDISVKVNRIDWRQMKDLDRFVLLSYDSNTAVEMVGSTAYLKNFIGDNY